MHGEFQNQIISQASSLINILDGNETKIAKSGSGTFDSTRSKGMRVQRNEIPSRSSEAWKLVHFFLIVY